jgi:hypothetical protein
MDHLTQCELDLRTKQSELETLRGEMETAITAEKTARRNWMVVEAAVQTLLQSITDGMSAEDKNTLQSNLIAARDAVPAAKQAYETAVETRKTKSTEIDVKRKEVAENQACLNQNIADLAS